MIQHSQQTNQAVCWSLKGPALNSTNSTYWLLKLGVSEFASEEAARIACIFFLKVCGMKWRISTHLFFSVSILLNTAHTYVVSQGTHGDMNLSMSFSSSPILLIWIFVFTLQLQAKHKKVFFSQLSINDLLQQSLCHLQHVCAPCDAYKTSITCHSHPHPSTSFMFYR